MQAIICLIMCIAVEYNIPPYFVKAIALTENWTLNPNAVGRNTNGTYDKGVMQLNSRYFYGFDWRCPNANIRRAVQHIRWLMCHPWTDTFWSVALAYNAGITRLNGREDEITSHSIWYAGAVIERFNYFMGGRAPVLLREWR